MKCDVCGKEFNNADELKLHKEEFHPMDQGDASGIEDENPEVTRERENSEMEMPMPIERTP